MDAKHNEYVPSATRMYECKKCHCWFRSFQALGGHIQERPVSVGCHECSICIRWFATDQALGGHMALYKWLADNVGRKKSLDIDLNLPPAADLNLPPAANDREEEEANVKWPNKMRCLL
ncbi:Zinc finger protein [Nymphaea thermarum]|nr:Zinc finger protein [Nymphaea thermarum]